MTPISTGYQPQFGLGALYQGFNTANADRLNEEEVLKAFLQNQKEQNEAPLNQIIKTWEAKQAQGKMDDPEYLPKSLEGYKGQMNSQIAAGNKGMRTWESDADVTVQGNKNKFFMGKLLEDWNNARLTEELTSPENSIGFDMSPKAQLNGQWGGEGLQKGRPTWSGPNPPERELRNWSDWGNNQLPNIAKQSDMLKSFGVDSPTQPTPTNVFDTFKKPNVDKLQNILVNTPEQLQKLAQIQAKGDEALQLQGLRNESALAVAMQRLQDKSGKPLSMKDTIAKAARIIHGLEPGDVEAARMFMRELENSQLRSNPAGYAPGGINLQGTQESGKYQTFPSPVQQSGALNIQGILPSINSAPTGTLSDGTKFTVKNNK